MADAYKTNRTERGQSTEAESALLARAVNVRFGLQLQPGMHSVLLRAGQELVSSGAAVSIGDVTSRVRSGEPTDPVVRRMREASSVGETYFFRAPEQLQALRTLVLSTVLRGGKPTSKTTLRIWSAGCSTGEEVYTLAALFCDLSHSIKVTVLGTDMNEKSLEIAKLGIYRQRSFRGVRLEQMSGIVRKKDRVWEVLPSLRRLVSFEAFNLVTEQVPNPERGIDSFDVITCRNVLIYLEFNKAAELMRRLSLACARTSVIAISPAEYSVAPFAAGFKDASMGLLSRIPSAHLRSEPIVRKRTSSSPDRPAVYPPAKLIEAPVAVPSNTEMAIFLADRADYGAAIKHATAAVAERPDSHQTHLLLGRVLQAAGDVSKAARAYKSALFLQRDCVAAELGLGQLLAATGKVNEARKHFARAVRLLEAVPKDTIVDGLDVSAEVALRLANDGG